MRGTLKIFRAAMAILAFLAGSGGCRSYRDYIAEADRLFTANRYDDAALLYRKAIQKNPKSADAYCKLGLALRASNQNAAAYSSFLRAVSLNPEQERAQIELGDLYLGDYLTEPVKSVAVYQKIAAIADRLLTKDPKSYAGLRLRGYLAMSDKKPEEAISFFKRANEVNPMQPDVVLGLTQGLLMAGHYADARKTGLELIEKNKTFGPIYDVLYACATSTGHADDAESLLKLKIANNPQNRAFILQLARHYWRSGNRVQTPGGNTAQQPNTMAVVRGGRGVLQTKQGLGPGDGGIGPGSEGPSRGEGGFWKCESRTAGFTRQTERGPQHPQPAASGKPECHRFEESACGAAYRIK